MAKEYTQKDLGYPRKASSKRMYVTMPNGAVWSVPIQIIADSRDEYYKEDEEDTIKSFGDTGYEIGDWASGNMNWVDVKEYARKEAPTGAVDFQEGWCNGEKEIK